jgi:hypothetical protein
VEEGPGFRSDTDVPGSAGPQPPYPPPPSPPTPPMHRHHGRGGWVLAVVLIIIGIVFLIKNMGWVGDWSFNNWWALFILIPAVGSFGNAWSSYVSAGRRFDAAVGRSVMFGVLFVAITIIFLLQLNWDKFWPVILIIIGLGLVLGWRRRHTRGG